MCLVFQDDRIVCDTASTPELVAWTNGEIARINALKPAK